MLGDEAIRADQTCPIIVFGNAYMRYAASYFLFCYNTYGMNFIS